MIEDFIQALPVFYIGILIIYGWIWFLVTEDTLRSLSHAIFWPIYLVVFLIKLIFKTGDYIKEDFKK